MSLNRHEIIGRLGKDPEIRHLENGSTVASFSVATSMTWKDRNTGEKREKTEWHNCVIWGELAEVVEKYVKKGDQIYLAGRSETRSWEKDGVTRYTTELIGTEMTMLGGNSNSQSKPPSPSQPEYMSGTQSNSGNSEEADDVTDDLPF